METPSGTHRYLFITVIGLEDMLLIMLIVMMETQHLIQVQFGIEMQTETLLGQQRQQ
ncbi:hypothetical protein D3C85_1759090 [compost metagenome]